MNTRNGRIKITSNSTEKGKEWFISATSDANLKQKTWSYTLTGVQAGEGRWDAWISSGEFQKGQGYEVTVESTVGDPATASGVIAVGAYATKLQWTNWKGEVYGFTQADQKLNDIASFSSLGPTRDGRTKPDIVAPGMGVASARSWKVPPDPSDPDEFHTILAGTSMAAPHITGLVALILQFNPYLTTNQVKEVLKSGARTDRFTHAIDPEKGSNTWGWGKADAKTSVSESANLFAITVALQGLPATASVDLKLDGTSVTKLNGSGTFVLELKAGNYRLEVDQIVPYSDDMRYRAKDNSIFLSKGGHFAFQYATQYHLQVESDIGKATGTGWYDAGTQAVFSVKDRLPGPTGTDYLLISWKVTYVFDHWSGDTSSKKSSDSVKMDGPKAVNANWQTERTYDYTVLIILVVTVSITLVTIVLVHRTRGRSRKSMVPLEPYASQPTQPTQVIPPVPAPTASTAQIPTVPPADPRTTISGMKFCIHCGQSIPQGAKFCTNIQCGLPQE